jgi:LAGLIDADG DNA endonuclease family
LILNDKLKQIMIGLLLGDGNMQTFSKTGKTWRFRILQGGDIHYEYINHLRLLFDDWTSMSIRENHEKRKDGVVYKKWFFNTLCFEQFAEIGNAFYKWDINLNKRKKIIPNNLKDKISDLSLAYWFMDDGSRKWSNKVLSLRFCTDSFSEQEIDLLVCILKDKFNLEVTKTRNIKNHWRLYVSVKSYEIIKELIYPHIIPSMKYKFPI